MKTSLFLPLLISVLLFTACSGATPPPATGLPATVAPAPATVPTQPTSASAPTAVPEQPTTAPAQPTTASAPTTAPTDSTGAPSGGGGDLKPPEGKAVDIVKKASLSAFDANTLRNQTLIVSAGGKTSTLVLEYIKPDRVHIVQSGPDGSAERIAIRGNGMWSKAQDGKWQAQGADSAALFFSFLDPKTLAESLNVIQDESVQFVGVEVLDNIPTFVYTYKIVATFGTQKTTGDGKIWIGAVDGRPYKVQSISPSLVTPGQTDSTTALYDYDIPLTIEPPQ